MQTHKNHMQRCIDLAYLGLGQVQSNPMVGSIIVHQEKIIGEGYHQKFGEAHAEVNAIQSVFKNHPTNATELLKKSTLYVNLEPCAHHGKTPPCSDFIIKHCIPKVVIANTDPFERVNGKGIEKLQKAGINVIIGVLDKEAKALNKRFFCRVQKQRPYIILKWAQTQNGFFAPETLHQKWISSPLAKTMVHQWRSQEDAVLIGFQTACIDNPQLNVREVQGSNPVRVVIDPDLALPTHLQLFDNSQKTLIFNKIKTDLQENNHFIQIPEPDYYFIEKILYQLYLNDISSVIVEGGRKTLALLLQKGLWDEARVFTSKRTWERGIQAPTMDFKHLKNSKDLGEDILSYFAKD